MLEVTAKACCHLSPFTWCLMTASFVLNALSPTGEEMWFSDRCSWVWLLWVCFPLPQSTTLCGPKSKSLCRKIVKVKNMACESHFAFWTGCLKHLIKDDFILWEGFFCSLLMRIQQCGRKAGEHEQLPSQVSPINDKHHTPKDGLWSIK